ASDDFLMENMGRLRSQILRTENELRSAKTSAGFVSAEQAEHFYGEQIAKIRAELYQDGAELKPGPAETNALLPAKAEISAGQLEDFQEVCTRLQFTRQLEYTYLTQDGYTEGNTLVKAARARIDELTKRKRNLEEEFPALASVTFPPPDVSSPTSSSLAIVPPAIPLPTEINVLKRQLVQIQNDAAGVDDAESRISDLQLEKQVEDRNYQSYAASLEEARINETLGAGGLSNISLIQAPSPLFKDSSEKYKVMRMMIAAGIISGILLAFLIEFYFDTSVKRAVEVESRLKIPLFLSIPDVSQNPDRYLAVAGAAERKRIDNHSSNDANGNSENGNGVIASGANGNGGMRNNSSGTGGFLNPFCDTLRDRLTAYFETINLTCKPKLVAVTGTDRGSGVSTIAAGLAASLSETGNGRVLLVDMNRERGAAQQFFRGETDCQLDDALAYEKRDTALVQENLYVVTEGAAENLKRILPSRFALLMPKLKASDYDYIIFDMPPVSQTSVTPRLARLMDMTLLVILSEKTDRYVVQEANALLTSAQATVGAVLNKTRRYLPDLLHRKSLGDV
ncbi:MAG TPA: hypothetical protein VGY98_03430, partial [Verrucomicrobiae bacterium]|nr:hypothetical protein [Verrucomicrobiae bacterium]